MFPKKPVFNIVCLKKILFHCCGGIAFSLRTGEEEASFPCLCYCCCSVVFEDVTYVAQAGIKLTMYPEGPGIHCFSTFTPQLRGF